MAKLPGSPRLDQYVASAGQTVFTYTFNIFTDAELKVQKGDTTLELTTDYTVQDAGQPTGGTITLLVGASDGDIITITGDTYVQRITEFQNNGDFLAAAINEEYDVLDDITSEILTQTEGAFTLTVPSPTISTKVPSPVADKCLKWNASEDALELSEYDPDAGQASAAAAAISAAAALVSENNAADSEDAAAISADEAAASAASINLSALSSDIIPDADGTRDLGSATKRFAEIHTDALAIEGDLTMSGNIAINTDKFTVEATNGDTVIDGTLTVGGTAITGRASKSLYQNIVPGSGLGGTAILGAWYTRVLNTEVFDDIGITLSANELIVPAGTYDIRVSAIFLGTGKTVIKLYNETDTADVPGLSGLGEASAVNNTAVDMAGRFTIGAAKNLSIKFYCSTTKADRGQGENYILSDSIYCSVWLEEVL